MSAWERIVHAILFEIGAIWVGIAAIVLFDLGSTHQAFWLNVIMSLMAVLYNIWFNWLFDKFFPGPRELRQARLRIVHAISFDAGLLLFTTPVIAYMLNISLWQALLTDLGLTQLLVVYSFCFNWAFDNLRAKLIAWHEHHRA